MQYLHTMVRVKDLDASLDFYCNKLGLKEVRRINSEQGRFTLVFVATPDDAKRFEDASGGTPTRLSPTIELTYNWDAEDYTGGRNFGHLAFAVEDIYATCKHLMDSGVTINRPPRDGRMAFVRSPDGISIELLQRGDAKAPAEPWTSTQNIGAW
jgi:lactoylglutathione lyase